ncbi:DUF664 domain-containing protein [Cellulomonas algicola]|uniref:mycothiol transferase n=1 Tax=Cellulomonas algicola TaxID=2071633 RepID=UPI001C3FA5B7|nr:DUF664 domain-containing protein [Cellulomonas algicola]
MTQNTLDTRITEPSATADETEMLLFSLERARAQFAWKVGGLDADALHRPFPPSAMTLGGLVKHLALVEEMKMAEFVDGEHLTEPWRQEHFQADPEWDWHSAASDTPEELYALWQRAVARSRAGWAAALARGGLDQPSLFTTESGWSPNLRRVLVDLIDEYCRHTGHADLFREAVDGLVGEDPPQAS